MGGERVLEKLLAPPVGRAAYSDRTAWLMAEMSRLAYIKFEARDERLAGLVEKLSGETNSKKIRELLSVYIDTANETDSEGRKALEAELEKFGFQLVGDPFNAQGTQAFLAKRESDRMAVLAFRGTEANEWRDVKADLNAILTDDEGARVHTGFQTAFEQVDDSITKAVEELEGHKLYVTGHSLGGAIALIATKHFNSDNLAACYTFGSPKVGTREFGISIKPPIYRVVNAADGVPRVPPTWIIEILYALSSLLIWEALREAARKVLAKVRGYRHHGDMRYLTATKPGKYEDVTVYRNPHMIDRATRFLRRITFNWKAPGMDHRIAEYCGKLRAYAERRIV